MGVDVGAAATAEGRKRDPALSCKFDGERRRCGDGEDDLDAAHGRLLNHFVGGSGTDDKRAVTPAPAGTKTEQLVKPAKLPSGRTQTAAWVQPVMPPRRSTRSR